jgi:hypothetical protein
VPRPYSASPLHLHIQHRNWPELLIPTWLLAALDHSCVIVLVNVTRPSRQLMPRGGWTRMWGTGVRIHRSTLGARAIKLAIRSKRANERA